MNDVKILTVLCDYLIPCIEDDIQYYSFDYTSNFDGLSQHIPMVLDYLIEAKCHLNDLSWGTSSMCFTDDNNETLTLTLLDENSILFNFAEYSSLTAMLSQIVIVHYSALWSDDSLIWDTDKYQQFIHQWRRSDVFEYLRMYHNFGVNLTLDTFMSYTHTPSFSEFSMI